MSSEQAGEAPGSSPTSERMRALLSRAAEEQLHEQRQVSAVLGELRTLVEDVDERLATGAQVEGLAAQVRALSARVEGRLDEAEARSAELAERITEATALAGRAADDLVEAVVAGVAERLEVQLRGGVATATASTEDVVRRSERRLATHVDDAVLALAEVVLRRRRPVTVPAPVPPEPAHGGGTSSPAPPDEPLDVDLTPPEPPQVVETPQVTHPDADVAPPEPADEHPASAAPQDEAPDVPAHDAPEPEALGSDAVAPELGRTAAHPGDGYVLVPADVEDADPEPSPVAPQERRTADRRGEQRSDGSGRRRRPWWRPA